MSRDVTAQVEAEQALTYQALHDPVTGLANRTALQDRLSQALLALERHPGRIALLLIDLDDFKAINDAVGHEAGDKVLVEVARRLRTLCGGPTRSPASAAMSSWCSAPSATATTLACSASGS